jgi:hypothetical protein
MMATALIVIFLCLSLVLFVLAVRHRQQKRLRAIAELVAAIIPFAFGVNAAPALPGVGPLLQHGAYRTSMVKATSPQRAARAVQSSSSSTAGGLGQRSRQGRCRPQTAELRLTMPKTASAIVIALLHSSLTTRARCRQGFSVTNSCITSAACAPHSGHGTRCGPRIWRVTIGGPWTCRASTCSPMFMAGATTRGPETRISRKCGSWRRRQRAISLRGAGCPGAIATPPSSDCLSAGVVQSAFGIRAAFLVGR